VDLTKKLIVIKQLLHSSSSISLLKNMHIAVLIMQILEIYW